MGGDGMDKGPRKPKGVGTIPGFDRTGKPNVERKDASVDDPNAFVKVAIDMQRGMQKTIEDNPGWGDLTKAVQVDTEKYLRKGEEKGLKTLEDDLETALHFVGSDAATTVNDLALATAYLKLIETSNEDTPDFSRET